MKAARTLAALTLALTVAPALAPALAPAVARAEPRFDWRRIYMRGGVARVATLEQSREMELADIDGAASLAVQDGPIAGSGAALSSSTIPLIVVGYRLRAMQGRLSVEMLLGTPPTVKFSATGTLANESIAPMALGIPTGVPALGAELGEAQALPVVATLVYQIRQRGPVLPYAGAGPAVLIARNAKITNPILSEVGQPEFSIPPAPGLVLQAGVDIKLWKQVYARFDAKFIAGMLARASVKHTQVRTPTLPLFETVEVGTAKMTAWVNPLILLASVGFDFTML